MGGGPPHGGGALPPPHHVFMATLISVTTILEDCFQHSITRDTAGYITFYPCFTTMTAREGGAESILCVTPSLPCRMQK